MSIEHVRVDEAAAIIGTTRDKLLLAAVEDRVKLWAFIGQDGVCAVGVNDFERGDADNWLESCLSPLHKRLSFAPLTPDHAMDLVRLGTTSFRGFVHESSVPSFEFPGFNEVHRWQFNPPIVVTGKELFVRWDELPRIGQMLRVALGVPVDDSRDVPPVPDTSLGGTAEATAPGPLVNQAAPIPLGDAMERLLKAVEAFPGRYPNYKTRKPKLDDDVRMWLEHEGFVKNASEKRVFGSIIKEHFELFTDTQKTK